ncbi:alkaline phosphatase family protein [Angustibacter sp. Root456]|uniref:alkaline phosphatase family protein n=1 Tax=Angustibacter sp. Root456 TaxID=1736539 RepID=UPI0009EB0717|nr:alkaline phosphatase family protein [Angustibacter sp. Root456]
MSHRRAVIVAPLLAVVLLAAACGGSAQPTATGTSRSGAVSVQPSAPSVTSSPQVAAAVAPHVSKLLVIVLENHSRSQALTQMPALAAQARRYGQATQWYAVAHPSLPNYLELAGGSTFGVRDDKNPSSHHLRGRSVFGQLYAAHHSVRAYVESMPSACAQTNSGRYAVRHNAWAYFTWATERTWCRRYDIPAGTTSRGALHDDIVAGRLPRYAQLIPDVCHDGHDCSLATADAWLGAWLKRIEAGPDFTSGRLAVVVTFDEDDRHASNHVAFVVAAAQLHGRSVSTRFTHASLAAAPSRLVGLRPLRYAASSPDVLKAFGLR